jgi:1-pyrroline-5-carboxylate dehydrogenase
MPTSTLTTVGPFVNEPITDYRKPENVRGMRDAIAAVRKQLGREYHLVIGGRHSRTKDKIVSVNPANPSEVIGIHQKAGVEHVEPAMQAALAAFETWQYAGVEERTGVLFRTAEILRRRKFEFNAWLVLEVGKNYDEAEADTAEAIDFLELYAASCATSPWAWVR